jgi:hypothetical protein
VSVSLGKLHIRLRPNTRENAPLLYRLSPKGGRVLHATGRLERDRIPKNIKGDAQNFYWQYTLMRGDFRCRYERVLRERNLHKPGFKGP